MDVTDEIERVIEARVAALMRKDAASANAVLDPAIVAFEAAGPLQIPPDRVRDNGLTQAWLDSFDEGPEITIESLTVHADGKVAFCHSLIGLKGRPLDGQKLDLKMRSTLGLRKTGGEWKIVHAHTSFPR